MPQDHEIEQASSDYLNTPALVSIGVGGSAGTKAFDEGRASAMQKLGMRACPYSAKTEFGLRELWMAGYRSFTAEGHPQAGRPAP